MHSENSLWKKSWLFLEKESTKRNMSKLWHSGGRMEGKERRSSKTQEDDALYFLKNK